MYYTIFSRRECADIPANRPLYSRSRAGRAEHAGLITACIAKSWRISYTHPGVLSGSELYTHPGVLRYASVRGFKFCPIQSHHIHLQQIRLHQIRSRAIYKILSACICQITRNRSTCSASQCHWTQYRARPCWTIPNTI